MKIYHYTELHGDREYVILTEDDDFDVKDNCVPGFMHDKDSPYEFDGDTTGALPMDLNLFAER